MSIFSESASPTGASASSESELATMAKDNSDMAAEPAPKPEPVAETPQPEPAAVETATPDAPADGERPARDVPAAAIAEERQRRRAVETELANMRGQLETLQRFVQPQPQAQQQEAPPPDWNEDPIGRGQWESERRQQLEQQVQRMTVEARVRTDYGNDARQFMSQTPDFAQAYEHLIGGRVKELQTLGATPDQIRAQVAQEEFTLVIGALRANASPSQRLYELARHRGYQKAAQAPAKPAAVDPDLQEARARAAVSLSEGGKPEKGGELSLDDIANLRGAAQESALAKYERTHHRRQSIFRE